MSIFIDTGIWIGFFNLDDEQAARSSEIIEEIQKGAYGVAWTSTFVLDELYTFLERKTNDTQLAIEAMEVVLGEYTSLRPFVKIYPISIENCVQTLNLAEKYSDKRMSFTDLTSILICQKLKISYIASFDIIPLKELVFFFIKRLSKKEVAIDMGMARIIELTKVKSKIIYYVNIGIGVIQIVSSLFIFSIIS